MNAKLPETLLSFILFFLKSYRIGIYLLVILTFIYSLDIIVRPYLLKIIIDTVSAHPNDSNIATLLYFPIMCYIVGLITINISLRLRDYIEVKIFPALKGDIVEQVTKHLALHSYKYFQNNLSGSLVNKIFNLDLQIEQIIKIVINSFLPKILSIIVSSIVLSCTNKLFAVIICIWSIIFFNISIILSKRVKVLTKVFSESRSNFVGIVSDSITNIINVNLFSRNSYEMDIIKTHSKEVVLHDQVAQKFRIYIYVIQSILVILLICVLIYLLLYLRQNNAVTAGDFALVMIISFSIADAVYALANDYVNFSNYVGAAHHALSTITTEPSADKTGTSPFVYKEGKIEFKNVTFGYTKDKTLLYRQSIIIPGKQKVGLVGYSGSGKTTFVNLICRLFDTQFGHILIDNQNIQDLQNDSLKENISVIPQDLLLFNRTIRDNIRYGKLNATDVEIIEAAYKADAHSFIINLPEGYDTIVGDRGIKLSTGQKQRIAIARAVIKDAPIFILDEPTSALDAATEELTKKNLIDIMQYKTVLIISHRISTLLSMDRILVFDQGRIIEDGTHNELIAKKGIYYSLWYLQGYFHE